VTECALIEIRVHLDEEKSSIFLFENDSPVRDPGRHAGLRRGGRGVPHAPSSRATKTCVSFIFNQTPAN